MKRKRIEPKENKSTCISERDMEEIHRLIDEMALGVELDEGFDLLELLDDTRYEQIFTIIDRNVNQGKNITKVIVLLDELIHDLDYNWDVVNFIRESVETLPVTQRVRRGRRLTLLD